MHKQTVDYEGEKFEIVVSDYLVCRSVAARVPGQEKPIVFKLSFPPKMSEDEHIQMVVEEAYRRRRNT